MGNEIEKYKDRFVIVMRGGKDYYIFPMEKWNSTTEALKNPNVHFLAIDENTIINKHEIAKVITYDEFLKQNPEENPDNKDWR